MRTILSGLFTVMFLTFLLASSSCNKKKDQVETSTCKTCKAFATSSLPETSKEVCSDAAEQDFRSAHTTQEISCR